MENKKTVWWVLGILVVLVIIFIAVRSHNRNAENAVPADQSGDTTALTPTEDLSAGSARSTENPLVPLTYQQALAQYGTYRIEFDSVCQAKPANITWKNNTTVMLDNRSALARNIHLGFMGDVSVKAWGFKIVTLSTTKVPNTMLVDCGTKQNVATILLQK